MIAVSAYAALAFLVGVSAAASGQTQPEGCVAITGATGFVAGHVIEVLLIGGYAVHGTVRSLKREDKYAHLKALEKKYDGTIKLFEADLMDENAFRPVFDGCWGLLHVASPGPSKSPDPMDTVRPAVEGTKHVLKAASETPSIKHVVVTSSVVSIAPSKAKIKASIASGEIAIYTEDDWNDVAALTYGTYSYSKTMAERAGNEFQEANKPAFTMATIHFPMGIGPQQNEQVTSSNKVIEALMTGGVPMAPLIGFSVVDIRDVAAAHVHVLEHHASGRYIVATEAKQSAWRMGEIGRFLKQAYPAYPIPTMDMPNFLLGLLEPFDDAIDKYVVDAAARPIATYDGTKITRELGFTYRFPDAKVTIVDAAQSMVDLGLADGSTKLRPAVIIGVGCVSILVLAGLFFALRAMVKLTPVGKLKKR